MYKMFVKRSLDFVLALVGMIVLSPIYLILIVAGTIAMKGNPFFVQSRPGKCGKDGKQKIFNLVKFRTMSNARDEDGNLLPDSERLNKYGKILRASSLDELGELWNILIGDMSIVGPRPLLVKYLEHYNSYENRRHEVRPGLTGLAQVSGRNAATWKERFQKDIEYVDRVSFLLDVKIFFLTINKIFVREGIEYQGNETINDYFESLDRVK